MCSEKTVVIHQPDFLPWLGFFQRLLSADLYLVLDNAQFLNNSRSWHNRDKIKTPQGERWLTVSVRKTAQKTPINQVLLADNTDWRGRNLSLLKHHYRRAPFFDQIYPELEHLYRSPATTLLDFNLRSIKMLLRLFAIDIPLRFAGELNPAGSSNAMLVDLLKKTAADRYLSGNGARAYFDPEPFRKAGIKVCWQSFRHPVYPQLHGDFIPGLSSIDLFFNCGIEQSRAILRSTMEGVRS
ncbi:WbqC family protein [Geothermobacter hydrogeniphilus]|uniref:WbqC-like protein family protein n=1 Tax=Geothermobacter hydrogeniphilus TaxID=1969733 RepID=A0A1X0YE46_9BACT|nr:WbqC family protein [Geothermobacter hydrogeniphilus]ORJ63485.1 hypothetical protein B5V00_01060 [Geothermobacter hydrogeniphilus]